MKKSFLIFFGFLSFLMTATNFYSQISTSGSETIVNTTTANDQKEPAVAMDSSGNYVVVWSSQVQDGMDYGVFFQRYNNSGTPIGSETQVNVTTNHGQRKPDVAMNPDGSFVITWQSNFEDTDGSGVWFALYDNTGSLIQRNRVNDSSADEQMDPTVAMRYDGYFVVGYSDDGQDGNNWGVSFQGFSSTGVAQFGEKVPNSTTLGYQGLPDVAIDSAGNYTWVWQSENNDGSGMGIFMQRYDKNNNTIGSETQVNTTTSGNQQEPSIAIDRNGNTLICWSSYGQDSDQYGIVGQLYDNNGNTVGGEIQINTTTADVQDNADVSVSYDGTFFVSWTSFNQDGDKAGVYMQGISTNGSFYGTETLINSTTNNYQQLPAIASYKNTDDLVVVWQSGLHQGVGQDGDDYGVYMQRFSIADITDPVANCQNISVYLNGSGNVSISGSDLDNGSTDNVGIATYTPSISSFSCTEIGTNSVTLTVADAAGNTDNCTSTVTVLDTVSPIASCQNITVYLNAAGNATITAADIDNGSTDNCSTVNLAADITTFTCSEVGANTVTLTVTDGSSNTSSCTSTVTVLDTISPTVSCQNITAYLNASGSTTITANDLDNGSSDNCSTVNLSADITTFSCSETGANTVTLTATDGSTNTATCSSTVTVLDTISPIASCQNITVYLNATGNATITPADIDNGSTDNCSTVNLAADITTFTCSEVGANTVTLTVTDGSSNTANCTSTVTVLDTVSPTASCQNITVYLSSTGTATITAADIDNGSSDNCSTVNLSADITAFTCSEVGANTVTLTATDGASNSSTCTSTVTVLDTISPIASCQNITVYLDAAGNATITPADVDNGSSDNCGVTSLLTDITTFTCSEIGTNTVTLTVTDGSSNTASCSSTVTVLDTISPTASCQNITVYLSSTGTASITAADIDNGSSDNCTVASLVADITTFTCSEIGANSVTLTVTDGSSNSNTCTSTVTVLDTISPVPSLTLLANITSECAITSLTNPTVTDNCSGTITITNDASLPISGDGTTIVTWTYDDGNGNTSTQTQNVIIDDITAPVPVITSLTDITSECTVTTLTAPTATDNCAGTVTVTNNATLPISGEGTTIVTWTYDDGNGNTSTQTQNVIIDDVTAPVADNAILTDITAECSVTALIAPSATDNCGGTVTVSHDATLPISGEGTTTVVTWTYDDGNGNTSTQTQNVIIDDITVPVVSCPINQTESPDANCQFTLIDYTGLTSVTDNCSTASTITQSPAPGTIITGTTTIWMIGNDGNGNTDSCSFDVILSDIVAPTAVCQDVNVYLDITGNITINDDILDGGSSDNCSGLSFSAAQSTFNCNELGTNTIVLTVTDGNSNTATCSSTITVIDTVAPTPDVITLLDATGECNVSLTAPVATDNCNGAITATTTDPINYNTEGTYVVTWNYEDALGNTSSQTQNVIVDDITPPLISCLSDTSYLVITGSCDTTVSGLIPIGISDNCTTSPTLTYSLTGATTGSGNGNVDGLIFSAGITNVTYTVDDGNGNTTDCNFNVTVIDNEAPTITCNGDLEVSFDESCAFTLLDYTSNAVTSDNCALTITQSPAIGTSITSTTIITLIATDPSGNADSCTFNITPVDNTPPTITCLQDETVYLDQNCEVILEDYTQLASVNENCGGVVTITQSPLPGQIYTISGTMKIVLYAEDIVGNIDSCDFTLTIDADENSGCQQSLIVSDLLTPNGDGQNDTWKIKEPSYVDGCDVSIYNRWGQKVYQTTSYQNEWDGTKNGVNLPDGAYFYVIECDGEVAYKGPITLMRLAK